MELGGLLLCGRATGLKLLLCERQAQSELVQEMDLGGLLASFGERLQEVSQSWFRKWNWEGCCSARGPLPFERADALRGREDFVAKESRFII